LWAADVLPRPIFVVLLRCFEVFACYVIICVFWGVGGWILGSGCTTGEVFGLFWGALRLCVRYLLPLPSYPPHTTGS
jgi:hypothetical protein